MLKRVGYVPEELIRISPDEEPYTIGRLQDSNLVLSNADICRVHCVLYREGTSDDWYIYDLSDKGMKVKSFTWTKMGKDVERRLHHGDIIKLTESVSFQFLLPERVIKAQKRAAAAAKKAKMPRLQEEPEPGPWQPQPGPWQPQPGTSQSQPGPWQPQHGPWQPQPGTSQSQPGPWQPQHGPWEPQPGPWQPQPGTSQSQPGPWQPQHGPWQPQPGPWQPQPGTSQSQPGPWQPQPGTSQCQPGPWQSQPGTSQSQPGPWQPQPGTSQSQPGPWQPQPGTSQSQPGPWQPQPGPWQPQPGTSKQNHSEHGAGCGNGDIEDLVCKHKTERREALKRQIAERNPLLNSKLKEFESILESECMCAICMDVIIDAATLNCGHSFCNVCISEWAKFKPPSCPTCRGKIRYIIRSAMLDNIVEKMADEMTRDFRFSRSVSLGERAGPYM